MKCKIVRVSCLSSLALARAVMAVAVAGTVPLAARAEVPFSALRFGSEFTTSANWPGMRAALAKNRAAFDEVWFSTGVSFPPLAWHEERARQCAAAADDLRRLGIVPSIEIQTIIGHTDEILDSGDCTGQTWSTWVGCDGTVSKHVACPRDKRLAAYFARVAELHAAWKPGSIWIDDDVTLRNRAPMKNMSKALVGCFCDGCLAAFSERENRQWTRPELSAAIRRHDGVEARWWAFNAESLATLAGAIVRAAHTVSPTTRFGYQFGWSWDPAIVKAMASAGGYLVRLRPGAGAYWDTDAHTQLDKAYFLQLVWRKYGALDCVEAVCPEIESCPRTFSCRTPQGIILEAFESLALGMDFLSMFVADARPANNPVAREDVKFYADRLFPRLASAHGFLKGYRDAGRGSRPCGFSVPDEHPARLVVCRGIPIAPAGGMSLGELPDVNSIPVRMSGSGTVTGPTRQTRVMQIASGPALMDFARRCDAASGGRLPVLFDEPVMAWVLPRVTDGWTLRTLAVVNASIDRQDPVGMRLRGVPDGAKALWHTPESSAAELSIVRDGGLSCVVLPRLGAWQCGYLEIVATENKGK